MPACPTCHADLAPDALVCPRCSTPTPWSSDVTHLAASAHDAPTHLQTSGSHQKTATRGTSMTTSWSTTSDIDHGRFAPGTVLDGRYRVIGRLGKGGMGEVYRADDLRLGQPVALKFLPESVDRDPVRLTQLHTEVRMARQVSHPNVCRVYDVGEYEGHTFLSMEYVDGEDLSTLLRRIGRFPQDRAIELARQICAGLAAAHDRGVVHRDLKPANIMLDGNGRIRITDFGLAGVAGEAIRAGTPAYMAPEQLAGAAVTPRSDVYSLGLVLYELFTGHRALEGSNVAELIAKREQSGGITQPSEVVRDLDPAIDRAIMRCLDPDPARRPASALAVAAALPGGDPLAAALAAGETPSPEMVAAAGATSALQPLPAMALIVATLTLLAVLVGLSDRTLATSLVPIPKPPLLLDERVKEILGTLGYPRDSVDAAGRFQSDNGFGEYLKKHPGLGTADHLRTGRPPLLSYWRRGSPTEMVPTGDRSSVSQIDPPMAVSGMSRVQIDPDGRLLELEVVPPEVDPPTSTDGPGGTGQASPAPASPAPNWKALFDLAGLDLSTFTPASPEWTPPQFADTRAAWIGPLPGAASEPLRIEAAAYRGKPVFFKQVLPWTSATRSADVVAKRAQVSFFTILAFAIVVSLIAASAFIALHNIRRGRGDRRGALQLVVFVSIVAMIVGILNDKHSMDPNIEFQRFLSGQPLWAAGLLGVVYLALEPYVRRFWPRRVVTWSRLMARQWRDPLVGRDILLGIAMGVLVRVIQRTESVLVATRTHTLVPEMPNLVGLLGAAHVIAQLLNQVFNDLLNALLAVFAFVLLKILLRREWAVAAVGIGVPLIFFAASAADSTTPALDMITGVLVVVAYVFTIQRLGLLATVAMFLVGYLLSDAVVTFRTSAWFFGTSLLQLAAIAALACYGFYASRGGEPLFGRRLLD